MKKLFVFLVYLGFLAGAPSAAKAFTGGICPSGQDCWYVSYVCDSCSSDLRCQTPDIGVNPRYIQGITSGNNCAQNDYCYNDKNDHDKLVCNLNHEATNGGLCSPTCKGGGATPTPTPTPAPTPSPQPSPTATAGTATPTPTPTPGAVAEAANLSHPGQKGTTYLFAHSTDSPVNFARYNAIFYLLDKLVVGDEVEIVYMGKLYKYRVTSVQILASSDTGYLVPQKEKEQLVLQTCYPPGTSWKRLIVVLDRVGENGIIRAGSSLDLAVTTS